MRFLIFICLIGLSTARFLNDGPCPERPYIPAFNVEDFAGKWYEVRKAANKYDRGFECSSTFVTVSGNKTFAATRCEKHNGVEHCDDYESKQIGEGGIIQSEQKPRRK